MAKAGHNEKGATAVLVAIMLIVLFGAAALAFDVGLMYEERRELQRTADVAAHSGAQRLVDGQAAAWNTARFYVDENPTENHPGYDEDSDTIFASMACTGVPGFTVPIPCVKVTARTPDFALTFAKVLGFNETAINAQATAVWAAASPSGLKLVPWTIVDCPNPALYPIETAPPSQVMEPRFAANCPYQFETSWAGGIGDGNELYLFDGTSGNFQGVQLRGQGQGCPAFDDVYFGQAGGNSIYRDTLSRQEASCTVDRGARVSTQTGSVQRNTYESVSDRIEAWRHQGFHCMTPQAFNATVDPVGGGTDRVTIRDNMEDNPCLMAVMFVVHTDPAAGSLARSQTYQGGLDFPNRMNTLMHSNVTTRDGRFSTLRNGASNPMVVRRFSYFYLTSNPDPDTSRGRDGQPAPWTGFFLKSQDGLDSVIQDRACTPTEGVCKVAYVYEGY
ncbi:MAG: pilus assembly protein TadG-related protein [Actinomycetota bacterium]